MQVEKDTLELGDHTELTIDQRPIMGERSPEKDKVHLSKTNLTKWRLLTATTSSVTTAELSPIIHFLVNEMMVMVIMMAMMI